MAKIWISDGSHPFAGNPHHPQFNAGTVSRESNPYKKHLVPLDVTGEFVAELHFVYSETGRSSVTLWFRFDYFAPVQPDDQDRYYECPVPLNYAPMRFAEFEKLLRQKNIPAGDVSGTFRFNTKGPSVSLELVR